MTKVASIISRLIAFLVIAILSACGGGGDSSGGSTVVKRIDSFTCDRMWTNPLSGKAVPSVMDGETFNLQWSSSGYDSLTLYNEKTKVSETVPPAGAKSVVGHAVDEEWVLNYRLSASDGNTKWITVEVIPDPEWVLFQYHGLPATMRWPDRPVGIYLTPHPALHLEVLQKAVNRWNEALRIVGAKTYLTITDNPDADIIVKKHNNLGYCGFYQGNGEKNGEKLPGAIIWMGDCGDELRVYMHELGHGLIGGHVKIPHALMNPDIPTDMPTRYEFEMLRYIYNHPPGYKPGS